MSSFDIDGPIADEDNRYHASTMAEVDALLEAEGMSVGLDVWANVRDAYIESYLGGDSDLGRAQLASLEHAVIAAAGGSR